MAPVSRPLESPSGGIPDQYSSECWEEEEEEEEEVGAGEGPDRTGGRAGRSGCHRHHGRSPTPLPQPLNPSPIPPLPSPH